MTQNHIKSFQDQKMENTKQEYQNGKSFKFNGYDFDGKKIKLELRTHAVKAKRE